jgi:hypothetical protein
MACPTSLAMNPPHLHYHFYINLFLLYPFSIFLNGRVHAHGVCTVTGHYTDACGLQAHGTFIIIGKVHQEPGTVTIKVPQSKTHGIF